MAEHDWVRPTLSVPRFSPYVRVVGPRTTLHERLLAMVLFRNRIMHYEPIHHRHLAADHATALTLLEHLSPELVRNLEPYDRVPEVLKRRPPAPSGS
jgi:hypothetical protein